MTRHCGIIITNQQINHFVRVFDGLCVLAVSPQEKNYLASILYEVHWAISQPRTKTLLMLCTQMKFGRGHKYRKRFLFDSATKAVSCSSSSVWTPSFWLGIWPAHNVQTVNSWKGELLGGWGLWRLQPCKFSRAHIEPKGPRHPTKKTRPQSNSVDVIKRSAEREELLWQAEGPVPCSSEGGQTNGLMGQRAPGFRLQASHLLVGAPAPLLHVLRLTSIFNLFSYTGTPIADNLDELMALLQKVYHSIMNTLSLN